VPSSLSRRIELANKIILDAISQKTKDYVGPEGIKELDIDYASPFLA